MSLGSYVYERFMDIFVLNNRHCSAQENGFSSYNGLYLLQIPSISALLCIADYPRPAYSSQWP